MEYASLLRKCIFCNDFFGCETKVSSKEAVTKTSDGCKSESINIECRKCEHGKYEENICKAEDPSEDNYTVGLCAECVEKYIASRKNKKRQEE